MSAEDVVSVQVLNYFFFFIINTVVINFLLLPPLLLVECFSSKYSFFSPFLILLDLITFWIWYAIIGICIFTIIFYGIIIIGNVLIIFVIFLFFWYCTTLASVLAKLKYFFIGVWIFTLFEFSTYQVIFCIWIIVSILTYMVSIIIIFFGR